MSLILDQSGEVSVKTIPDFRAPGLPQLLWFNGQEVTIAEGLQEIKEITLRDDVQAALAAQGVLGYLKSLRPLEEPDRFNPAQTITWLRSHSETDSEAASASIQVPDVELLGCTIAGDDFTALLRYVLTNTPVAGPEDPRISFLDELREQT